LNVTFQSSRVPIVPIGTFDIFNKTFFILMNLTWDFVIFMKSSITKTIVWEIVPCIKV